MLKDALGVMNFSFAIIFTVEMLLKILGMGFVGYFSNLWNCLDSFIVAVSCCRLYTLYTLYGLYSMLFLNCPLCFDRRLFLIFYLGDLSLSCLSLFCLCKHAVRAATDSTRLVCRWRDGCICRLQLILVTVIK